MDVHVRPAGTARRFADTDAGHRPLVTFLAPLAPALTVREATGGYERPAAAALAGGGRPVAVVNPARVREFATALGRRAKTDTIDAAVLAEFADTVLLTAGASAPEEHVQDCANRLIDRFGATVEHRSVREEHVSFPLPKELRVLARR